MARITYEYWLENILTNGTLSQKQIYWAYQQTDRWESLREERLVLDQHRCRMCNDPANCVHHRLYPEVYGEESVNDLTSLCNHCHEHFHSPKSEEIELLKKWFCSQLKKGVKCPICEVESKKYKVRLNKTYVRALAIMSLIGDKKGDKEGWFKVGQKELGKELAHDLNHMKYSKLRYFGLIEKMTEGHNRRPYAGFWRVTDLGHDFLKGKRKATSFVYEVHKKPIEWSDHKVDIHEANEKEFNFNEEVLGVL